MARRIGFGAIEWIFGLWFLVHGANFFVGFFPQPLGHEPAARQLLAALTASGLFAVAKIIEVLVGLAIISRRLVPLAVACALPVSTIICFHNLVLEHNRLGFWAGGLTMAFNIILLVGYRAYFMPLFAVRSQPDLGVPPKGKGVRP